MAQRKVLIIKHGFSETCDSEVSTIVSYGDVFRCTCLLEDFRDCHVSWVTAVKAEELLVGNHLIDRLILADLPLQLPPGQIEDRYDTVINLEKHRDWCTFAEALSADQKYGFKDWHTGGKDCFYPDSAEALGEGLDRINDTPLQETLFRTVGRQWTGQRYVLGHGSGVLPIYDIGLNYHVGPKWPNKAWPRACWQELHARLSEQNYSISWQQSLGSVRHYIDWLASSRMIVTCDSLGLHLALGLGRKVVSLFGPTIPEQVYMYGLGLKLTPNCDRPCVPCFNRRCIYQDCCMEHIPIDTVTEAVDMLLPRRAVTKTIAEPLVSAAT